MRSGLITKTRLSIVLVALFFIALTVGVELMPLGELFPTNGITRTDVPKFRVHYLDATTLKKRAGKSVFQSEVNVTANLVQLDESTAFRAHDDNGHYAYYAKNALGDIQLIEPDVNGVFPGLFASLPSHYSFAARIGKILTVRNDRDTGPLSGIDSKNTSNWDFEKAPPLIFCYGKSAIIYRLNKKKPNISCFFVKDLEKPVAKPVIEFENIQSASADRFGKQFFAIVDDINDGAKPREMRIIGANFDPEQPFIGAFETSVFCRTKLFHNGPAAALALLDLDKLRLISARTGSPIAVHYHRDLFGESTLDKSNEDELFEKLPRLSILPGVPAAIFGDKLIDMRSGKIVETLRNFSPHGVFAVDFKKMILYYTNNVVDGKPGKHYMTVNSYDLSALKQINQITITSEKLTDDRDVRPDNIAQMFLDNDGSLIVLTAPAQETAGGSR